MSGDTSLSTPRASQYPVAFWFFRGAEVTMTAFTDEQNRVWSTLYERQLPRIEKYACQEYLEGFRTLGLPADHIPEIDFLNQAITPRTGWCTERTEVRYTDAVPWYNCFARKTFLVTDYMRTWDELDFTPEPDMFHDIFGHLPFMVLPRYTELQEMFAPAFLRAGPEERERIKRLAWYSTEFGLIRERGELRLFGAGLMSSAGEIEHVMAGQVPLEPFSVENVIRNEKSIWNFNNVLFFFDSLEAVKQELGAYFDTH